MDREEQIKIILGEQYEQGREIANKVLDYLYGNKEKTYKNSVLEALGKSILEVFGHPLEYYDTKSRKRECVEVRMMAMYLYHELTGYSLHEVGEIFGKHHSTVIYAYNQARNLLRCDKGFHEDYKKLEKTIKNYL